MTSPAPVPKAPIGSLRALWPFVRRHFGLFIAWLGALAVSSTATLSLPGISAEARPDLSVLALMSAERRVLDHVAARRGHDTSQRRYMYKVEY